MIKVVMESTEFGREYFPRLTWGEAFSTIKNLVETSQKQSDGVERIIGVIVNDNASE